MSRDYRFIPGDQPYYGDTAASRGWGSGYPSNRISSMATFSIPTTLAGNQGGTSKWAQNGHQDFQVHHLVADMLNLILTEVQRRGYPLIAGWCWGYEDRAIGGTNDPSNHSWGLAVDLNAPDDPISFDGHRYTDMPSWIPDLFAFYGWAWGGDYVGSVHDSMHYEFMGTTSDAVNATASARTALGHTPVPVIPPPPPTGGPLDMAVIIHSTDPGNTRAAAYIRSDGTRTGPMATETWTAVNHLAKAGAAVIADLHHTDYDAFPLVTGGTK